MLRIALHWHACYTSWVEHDRGWAPWLVYLHCITFEIEVAYLASWAIIHGNAWLVVREPRPMSLWVINMIRDMIGAYIAWNALPCQVLPSAAVKYRFCRKIWPAGYLHCRPAIIVGRWIKFVAGDHSIWPVVFSFSRWCSLVSREQTLRLWRSSGEQSKENRGILSMAVDFRAEPSTHALSPLLRLLFTAFLD